MPLHQIFGRPKVRVTVFVSYSSDVLDEALAVKQLVENFPLPKKYRDRVTLVAKEWREDSARRHASPQEAIDATVGTPADCTLFFGIYWWRAGQAFTDAAGVKFLGGCDYELGNAKYASKAREYPKIHFYVKNTPFEAKTEEDREQLERFDRFSEIHLRTPEGEGATFPFATLEDLKRGIIKDLDSFFNLDIDEFLAKQRQPTNDSAAWRLMRVVKEIWINGYLTPIREAETMIPLPASFTPAALAESSLVDFDRLHSSLLPFFRKAGRRIMIRGGEGSGKTVALLGLLKAQLHRVEQAVDWGAAFVPVPVVFLASSWRLKVEDDVDADTLATFFQSWIEEQLVLIYNKKRSEAKELAANDRDIALFIDGVNEIIGRAQRGSFVRCLDAYMAVHTMDLVLTCRKSSYDKLPSQPKVTGIVDLERIVEADVLTHIRRANNNKDLVEVLEVNTDLRALATQAAMLQPMMIAFKDEDPWDRETTKTLREAEVRRTVYRNFVAFQLRKENKKPQRWIRDLEWLARATQTQKLFLCEKLAPGKNLTSYRWCAGILIAFTVTVLAVAPCCASVWYEWASLPDGTLNSGRFATAQHQALNVALTARTSTFVLILVCFLLLNGSIFGLGVGLAFGVARMIVLSHGMHNTEFGKPYPLREAIEKGGVVGVLFALLTFGLLVSRRRSREEPIRKRGHSRDEVRPLERADWSWPSFCLGVLVGAPLIPLLWVPFGQANGLGLGGAAALFSGLMLGIRGATVRYRVVPNQGIIQSLRTAGLIGFLVLALMVPLIAGVYGAQFPGDSHGVRAGITNGILAIAVLNLTAFFGLIPALQHYAVRLVLWQREKIPLRLVAFLKEAARINLLRQVGGGFVFRHGSLQTYFKESR
jgi:hypothetical protein